MGRVKLTKSGPGGRGAAAPIHRRVTFIKPFGAEKKLLARDAPPPQSALQADLRVLAVEHDRREQRLVLVGWRTHECKA
jgi:hypothetical protein